MTIEPGQSHQLKKAIKLRHAIALYVSSVLGSGILVLPGLAAQIAGPASLVAWVVLAAASYPFAFTFASLSARHPESGGIYGFAKESFGFPAAVVSGWLFAFWYITGAPAATLIAASYLAYAFPMSKLAIFVVAATILCLAFVINYRGIVFSNQDPAGRDCGHHGITTCSSPLLHRIYKYQEFSPLCAKRTGGNRNVRRSYFLVVSGI